MIDASTAIHHHQLSGFGMVRYYFSSEIESLPFGIFLLESGHSSSIVFEKTNRNGT